MPAVWGSNAAEKMGTSDATLVALCSQSSTYEEKSKCDLN
jgi:hypothetical protein